jgi:hypothetical protein
MMSGVSEQELATKVDDFTRSTRYVPGVFIPADE